MNQRLKSVQVTLMRNAFLLMLSRTYISVLLLPTLLGVQIKQLSFLFVVVYSNLGGQQTLGSFHIM